PAADTVLCGRALRVGNATDEVAVEQSHGDVGAGPSERHDLLDKAVDLAVELAPRGFRELYADRLEGESCSDRQRAKRRQIRRNDRRDLGIAPGRLAVRKQHDRLAVSWHLDRARCDAIGRDIEAAEILDLPATNPHLHSAGAGPDGVFTVEKTRHCAFREIIALRAHDNSELRRRAQIEPVDRAY